MATTPATYEGMSAGELLAHFALETARQIAANPAQSPAKRKKAGKDALALQAALDTEPTYGPKGARP